MPRQARKVFDSAYFHIMVQGINKEYIFDKPEDIKYYIKIMYSMISDYSLKIISYCIMNNHAHILIKAKKVGDMSKYMQRLNIKYSMYFNKKYSRIGHVFRNRFESESILNEKHLYNCIKYIYDNPVKAKICSKPEDYPYSNYNKERKFDQNIMTNEYKFIDISESNQNSDVINKLLNTKEIDIDTLKNDKIILNKTVKKLKNKYKVSFRKMEESFNISREKLRMIYYS